MPAYQTRTDGTYPSVHVDVTWGLVQKPPQCVCVVSPRRSNRNMGFLSKLPKPKLMFQVLHARVSHDYHLSLGTTPFDDAPPPRTATAAPPLPHRTAEEGEEANGRAD